MKTKEKDRIRKENISFVFQKNSLVRYLSPEDNLLLRNVTTAEKLPSDRFSSSSLSGGEEILIALANEIAKEKKIYLFDEVFDALDSLVLLVSHDQTLFPEAKRIPISEKETIDDLITSIAVKEN